MTPTHHIFIKLFIKIMVAGVFFSVLNPPGVQAMVKGECSNCHTMHDSQGALSMRLGTAPVTGSGASECYDCHAQLRGILLRMDCIGCHVVGFLDANNIVNDTPQVAHSGATDLAGGNFKHVFADDLNGHNVHGFPGGAIGMDNNHFNTPPGYDSDFDPSTGDYQPFYATSQVMCAGQNGCHGNRDEVSQSKAMLGAHHANDSMLQYGASFDESAQGTEVGTSYRYLFKVKGAEDADWQATTGINDHNEYRGLSFDAGRTTQAWNDIESMSTFCAECHGVFHAGSDLQQSNVWVRHPTDAVMPNENPFSSYIEYDMVTPVARPSLAAATAQASSTVTPGTDIVFCLSCHRSHASPYPSMLRWDYDTCSGGNANCGCYTCHSTY